MSRSEQIQGRNNIDIFRDRSICYKNTPPNPNDVDQISPVEFAQTRTAIRNYNQYIKDKPMMDAYAADVSAGTPQRTLQLQGQAGADLAQKKPVANFNPNMGMPSFAKGALLQSKVAGDLGRDAISQQAAAQSGILQSKLGIQSNVNTAQEGLARDAVARNIADSGGEYVEQGATRSAIASVLGAGASMVYNNKQPKSLGG